MGSEMCIRDRDSGRVVVCWQLVAQDSGTVVVYRQPVAQNSRTVVVWRQLVARGVVSKNSLLPGEMSTRTVSLQFEQFVAREVATFPGSCHQEPGQACTHAHTPPVRQRGPRKVSFATSVVIILLELFGRSLPRKRGVVVINNLVRRDTCIRQQQRPKLNAFSFVLFKTKTN